ncbi:MAG: transcriptional regulator NrdR [Candidatus Krumholzibacteria bacterium]|jgi:transcriptional repressor NrdR|nr:transcriptional regulator NrdR [Candidatus Krumholzibacteria bacterium]
MQCPRCGHDDDRVIDSRAVREGRAVRRRRECLACGERYTTYEAWETRPVLVIKRDGRRVAYDRARITTGIAKACEKRPVSLEQIEIIVDGIEHELAKSGRREVPTAVLGQMVLDRLREVDDVAYVRFASVYRSFQDAGEFLELLRQLLAARGEQP